METWEKELLLTNAIRQARVDSIEKSVDTDLEKARQTKYFKREGTPGHYKYYYTEAEYNEARRGHGASGLDTSMTSKNTERNPNDNYETKDMAAARTQKELDKLAKEDQSSGNKGSSLVGKTLLIEKDGVKSEHEVVSVFQDKPGSHIEIKLKNGDVRYINDFILDKLLSKQEHIVPNNPYSNEKTSYTLSISDKEKSSKDEVKKKLLSTYNISSTSKLDNLKLDGTDSAVDLSRALGVPIDGTNFTGLNETIKNLASGKSKDIEKPAKSFSSKEIANIFKKTEDWGDMGDRISASGDQLEVADSFYVGGKDRLNTIKKEWIEPDGYMAKYMKEEHGIKFTLHSEDIQDKASGKYKKFGKNLGAVVVKLNIEKA